MDIASIPLRVMVADQDSPSTRVLLKALQSANGVAHVVHLQDLSEAPDRLRVDEINTVFMNPLGFEIDSSSAFIFDTREASPEIVFVLFQDQERVEENREQFFHGDRRRFAHYYRLDKRTPVDSFEDELAAAIQLCQNDLSWRMSPENLRRLLNTPSKEPMMGDSGDRGGADVLAKAEPRLTARPQRFHLENTVFVSHRFAPEDEGYVEGLTSHLGDKGFQVITGKLATGYISQAVIQRIRDAEFFLCLLTRADAKADGTYTASAWLHQELGAAIAFGKPVVIMVEEGVTDLGGLQGDVQRIHFAVKGFMKAALDAAKILRAYSGRERVEEAS